MFIYTEEDTKQQNCEFIIRINFVYSLWTVCPATSTEEPTLQHYD